MSYYQRWKPYVPVARRHAEAQREAAKLSKAGRKLSPVLISGRAIATTFWGRAWCDNLEKYCDWENRMPRGRTYARNGSVIDLQIAPGKVSALVSGSSIYTINIHIDRLKPAPWKSLRAACSSHVASLLDLMRGRLSNEVIQRLTDPQDGIFPKPQEIKVACSCPDYARFCKHIAAALYGVGNRLDESPELFFLLRDVKQSELISDALANAAHQDALGLNASPNWEGDDLEAIFGVELSDPNLTGPTEVRKRQSTRKSSKSQQPVTAAEKQSHTVQDAMELTPEKPIRKQPTKKKLSKNKLSQKKLSKKKPTKKSATKKKLAERTFEPKPTKKKPAKKRAMKKKLTKKNSTEQKPTKEKAAKKKATKQKSVKKKVAKK